MKNFFAFFILFLSGSLNAQNLTFDSPVSDRVSAWNYQSFPISGACSLVNSLITIRRGTGAQIGQANCNSNQQWSTTLDMSSFVEGGLQIRLHYPNDAQARVKRNFIKDTQTPTLAFTAPSQTSFTNQQMQSMTIGGTCNLVGTNLIVKRGNGTQLAMISCQSPGVWMRTLDVSNINNALFTIILNYEGAPQTYSVSRNFTRLDPPPPDPIPMKPQNLVASPKAARIRLTWSYDPANDIYPATSYTVERSVLGSTSGFVAIAANLPITQRYFIDYNVEGPTTYYYRVRTNQGNFRSPFTDVVQSGLVAPPALTLTTSPQGTSGANLLISGDTTHVTHIKIERSLTGANPVALATLNATTTNYIDSNLVDGQYTYQITPYNTSVQGSPTFANFSIDHIGAPTLTANRSKAGQNPGSIGLHWQVTGQAQQFIIERSVFDNSAAALQDYTQPWESYWQNTVAHNFPPFLFTEVKRLPGSERSWRDTTVKGSNIYYYRIKAVSSSGAVSTASRTVAMQARINPNYPSVPVAAIQAYEITFTDGSKQMVNVLPDISVAAVLYAGYLRHIEYLNLYPHLAVARSVMQPFVACSYNYSENVRRLMGAGSARDKLGMFLGYGQVHWPGAEVKIYRAGLEADQMAWFEGIKLAQYFIALMKTSYRALTEGELAGLARVSSRVWVGSHMPVEATKVDDFWYGYSVFEPSKEILPVFGERIGVADPQTSDKILLYKPEYIRDVLRQTMLDNYYWSDVNVLLNLKAENILSNQIHTFIPKIPTPRYDSYWRFRWRYRYCLPGLTNGDEWLTHARDFN